MMTRDETKGLIMIIQAAFPNYHPIDKTVTVNLWFRQLQDYDYESVSAALDAYIATETSGFAPSVGQILDQYARLTETAFPSEMEAWAMYRKAISRASHSQEEYDRLPEIVQKAVGDPYNIYATGMSQNYNEDVTRANFLKSYRTVCAREREMAKMPKSARALIDGTAQKLIGNRTF